MPDNMEINSLPSLLVTRLIKERIDIVVIGTMLAFVCWFCYSLVGNVIAMTEKTTVVIEKNTQVIEAYKKETLDKMANDNEQIIDLLKDIKETLNK